MSAATRRQKPPPIAAPLMAPITGWCILRIAMITSSSSSMARRAIVVTVSPSMFGTMPESSRSAPEQNPCPAPVSTTTRTSLSWLTVSQRLAERDHHVERHRVHALGAVERDERDAAGGACRPATNDMARILPG